MPSRTTLEGLHPRRRTSRSSFCRDSRSKRACTVSAMDPIVLQIYLCSTTLMRPRIASELVTQLTERQRDSTIPWPREERLPCVRL